MTTTVLKRRKSPVRAPGLAVADVAGLPHRVPIAERILDCFPSGNYALSALLRLLDIVETDAVPTAAVECRVQPRMLVNPRFVAIHAATSEKLLMLVMHELHHVLLGHTTLFPTVTPEQNFVFDAVINGLISRMFPHRSFLSFLTDFYPADSFPACLLRPPSGWPGRAHPAPGIDELPARLRQRAVQVHVSLYSEGGATYDEVAKVLPRLLVGADMLEVPLLGGHGEGSATMGNLEGRSPVLFDIVRDIVERWPQPPDPIRGRSLSDLLKETRIGVAPPASRRSVLRTLIRKVANFGASGDLRQPAFDTLTVPTPLPVLSRRTAVLQALGQRPLLFDGPVPWPRPIHAGERVHVYLDVSGSMDAVKGALYGAILDCGSQVHRTVHLFSTAIADVSLGELRQGVCRSTGGTDITCVAMHMQSNRIRRALIVTDGWVGAPRGSHRETLSGARLAVAFFGPTINTKDLAEVANFTAHLPIGA
jgi:hypothetical protein